MRRFFENHAELMAYLPAIIGSVVIRVILPIVAISALVFVVMSKLFSR